MQNKSILVTGGAGYIGSKIVADLTTVYIIDNLSTGHKSLVNKKALFYNFNIGNKKKLNNFFSKTKISSIIHCAASLNIAESEKKPKKYFINNYINTKKLLEVIKCFEKKFKINIKKEYLPRRKGDIAEITSSTKNINKVIKIKKQNKLTKIISSTVEWEKYLKRKIKDY